MSNKNNLIAYLSLAAVCVIWGTTYLALRIAVMHFPPFLFSGIRQLVAGIILVAFMLTIGKQKFPTWAELKVQAFGGFLMLTLGNGLVAWAELQVSSGIAAIICSIMPIWVIVINVLIYKEEKPTLPIMSGIALGLLGIVLIFGDSLTELTSTQYLVSIVFIVIANISWAGGSVWMKTKHLNTNPFMNAGLQMIFGGCFMFPISLAVDDLSHVTLSTEAVYSFLYLIIFGSLIAYTCYTYAIRHLSMTIVSLYAYINPLVAIILGWLVLDEKLTPRIAIAFVITIAGIYMVTRGYQQRKLKESQAT